MSRYTDQVQERLDRLERMEPAFDAMREALQDMLDWYRGDVTCPSTQKAARAALKLAAKVRP